MGKAWASLANILNLERANLFEDRAVIGGLTKYVSAWKKQVLLEARKGNERASIEDIATLMTAYSAAKSREKRRQIIDAIHQLLAARSADNGQESQEIRPPQRQGEAPPAAGQRAGVGSRRRERSGLQEPVTSLSGISGRYAKKLERLGVRTIRDLLYLFPRRYEDYSNLKKVGQLTYGEEVTVMVRVVNIRERLSVRGLKVINAVVADETGAIEVTWFNQSYLLKQLPPGRNIVLSGRTDAYQGRLVMQSPEWEPFESDLIHTGRLVPVYPLTEGISARWLRSRMREVVKEWSGLLPDHLPEEVRRRAGLLPLHEAVAQIHFPDSLEAAEEARHRLAFDEFFLIQLGVLQQRRHWQKEPGRALRIDWKWLGDFEGSLPFILTQAQERALHQIVDDLQQGRPMSRLLQGDVGSGKTVVALAAMLMAVANGCQAALMAPTEILAEQHYRTVTRLLEAFPHKEVRVALLTGNVAKGEREQLSLGVSNGEVDIVIGTHALIQSDLSFKDLALVIVDEQHRFGVAQRGALRQKGYNPHMLVMSATPIPRSLSLTLYGDLDLSVIDELPAGRQSVVTRWLEPKERERAYSFIREQVWAGRQAYIICPLVEGSDKIEAKAAVEEYERLSKVVYPDLRLGLLHGRMKAAEKDAVMDAFNRGELDILVSTSVVEVGIDVPNATVMLVEGANRFGLAQLHQFRGRVGRGEHRSYCILLADSDTDSSRERLLAIENTQNGFELAERDLAMRGPGEFFGTRQSGLPPLKLAELGDIRTLMDAREEAQRLCAADPELTQPGHGLLAQQLRAFWIWNTDLS